MEFIYIVQRFESGYKTLSYPASIVIMGAFSSIEDAVKKADSGGIIKGDVWKWSVDHPGFSQEKVWGYREGLNGLFKWGYLDLRDDPLTKDPEYQDFVRLSQKFKSKG